MIYKPEYVSDLQKLIKHVMIDTDMQQADLAQRLNKSKQSISNLINKQDNYTINTLYQICNAMGCDLIIDIKPNKKV